MDYIIKKNVVPAFADDVKNSLNFLERAQNELKIDKTKSSDISLKLGLEAIVRYSDLDQLDKLADNLKACREYPLSVHLPLNHQKPETVDLTLKLGYENARKVLKFAEECKADFVVSHPNVLRDKEFFNRHEYTVKQRKELFRKLAESIVSLDKLSKDVRFTVENKPYPSSDERREEFRYSRLCYTFDDLFALKSRGVKQTFDTCHYAISRSTIHGAIATSIERKKDIADIIKKREMYGILPEDFKFQPNTKIALGVLGDAVINMHLNDGAPYRSVKDMTIYWEGLVPGKGNLIDYDAINFTEREEPFSIVAEVYERDYKNCPNTFETFESLIGRFRYKLN